MRTPQLSSVQIAEVAHLVAQYITEQREKYAHGAVPLSAKQRAGLEGFFSAQLLNQARLVVLRAKRVPDPDFYPMLKNMGFDNLPKQSTMAAITFADVVALHDRFSKGLLFHELVHVEQYRQLGIPRFAELYVRGFLSGGEYAEIPLEVNAYALEDRYERDPSRPFSVADQVEAWVSQDRF
jgi:hypothetical protein